MVVRAANVVIVVQVSRVIAFNLSLPNKPLHRTPALVTPLAAANAAPSVRRR